MKRTIKTNAIAFDSIPTRTTTMKLSATTLRNIGYDYTINEHGDIEFMWIGHHDEQRAAIMNEIASRVEMLGYEGHDHSCLMDALYEQMFRIDIASCIVNR